MKKSATPQRLEGGARLGGRGNKGEREGERERRRRRRNGNFCDQSPDRPQGVAVVLLLLCCAEFLNCQTSLETALFLPGGVCVCARV